MLFEGKKFLAGARAALMTPAAIERDLDGLLVAPADAGRDPNMAAYPEARRVARFAIRLLARLPGGRWRNTCLYRSVAECLALRRLGVPARVCMGVGKEGARRSMSAHAWVEAGEAEGPSPRGLTRLAAAQERRSAHHE